MTTSMIVGPRGGIFVDDGGHPAATGALPLVLVHGAAGSAAHWAPVAERLRARRRVLLPELPGHGHSDPPLDLDWSVEALAEALHLVVQERALGRFVLGGHSLAGAVVAEYAAEHGDRVAALLFADSGAWVPSREDLDELRRGFRPEVYERFTRGWYEGILRGAQPSTRDLVLRGLAGMPRANFMALMYGGAGYDMRAAAARYAGPKLALCAETSGMAQRWEGTDVAVKRLPGVSHWLQLDAPDAVAVAIGAWLASAGA